MLNETYDVLGDHHQNRQNKTFLTFQFKKNFGLGQLYITLLLFNHFNPLQDPPICRSSKTVEPQHVVLIEPLVFFEVQTCWKN